MLFNRTRAGDAGHVAGGLRQHDPDALARLYDAMGAKLYSVILAIVRNPTAAEDIVQDTFVRAWNRSEQFVGDNENINHWLFAIARHRALDYIRANRRRPEQGAISFESGEQMLPSSEAELSRPSRGEAYDVREAIVALAPQHRKVIELAYYEGLSQVEIAARLQQPLGTVKAWTRVALKHLREAIDTSVPCHQDTGASRANERKATAHGN